MIRIWFAILMGVFLVSASAWAQPKPPPDAKVPMPVDVVLDDLAAAYSKTFAETVRVRFRPPGAPERTDTVTIRMQAGADPGSPHQRALLELGTIRVLATRQSLIAIGTAIPSRYFERDGLEVSIPNALATTLPPIPLPQLALASIVGGGGDATFATPAPYVGKVAWNSATADTSVRPAIVVLSGNGRWGPVTVTLNAETARLLSLSATLRTRDGEGTLDLTCHAIEPGDPAAWVISTEGRERVPTLAQLRPPPPKPSGVKPGEMVPDLSFSRPSLGSWSLYSAQGGVPGGTSSMPAVLLMFRVLPNGERNASIASDADAGREGATAALKAAAVLNAATGGGASPVAAAAVIIELGDFKTERLEEARQRWGNRAGDPGQQPVMDELLWSSGAAQSIDRFAPGAGAALIVVGPDRRLRRTINLDGRSGDAAAITAEITESLREVVQEKEAPKSEPPR